MAAIAEGSWGPALLPGYAVLETLTVLAFRRGLPKASEAGQALLESRELQFVPCSDVFLDAYARFKAEKSARPSLTDAAIMSSRSAGVPATSPRSTATSGELPEFAWSRRGKAKDAYPVGYS
jgi:hypothetical protein